MSSTSPNSVLSGPETPALLKAELLPAAGLWPLPQLRPEAVVAPKTIRGAFEKVAKAVSPASAMRLLPVLSACYASVHAAFAKIGTPIVPGMECSPNEQ